MGLKSTKTSMTIRLEHGGITIFETTADQVTEEITIGRASDCKWVIPATDKSASNHHASLINKRGRIYVIDTKSRNGIYFQGAKVPEHKLAEGDQIGIGDCRLYAESPQAQAKGPEREFNQLEQLNGEKKGQIINLNMDAMRMGSASDCEICLNDSVVSHFHATIEQRKDGSSWIRDLGSRNGTTVNGSKLSGASNDSGRLLKDGDVIAVAYIEFRFLDKYTVHVRSHLLLKTIVCILTFGILMGGYYAWQTARPSAKKQIDMARECARNRKFAEAKKHLDTAATARSADRYQAERKELLTQVGKWEETAKNWEDVKALLKERKWISANKILSPMLSDNMELWRWNDTDANQAKNEAKAVKEVIDAYLEGRNVLEDIGSDKKQLASSADNMARVLDGFAGKAPDYSNQLIQYASDIREELKLTVANIEAIENDLHTLEALEKLDTLVGNIEAIRDNAKNHGNEREKAGKRFSTVAVRMAEVILEPLYKLQKAKNVLDQNYAVIAGLEFDKAVWTLPLPTVEECNVYPVMADKRLQLDRLNRQLEDDAQQIGRLWKSFSANGMNGQDVPPILADLSNSAIIDKVLACDCLEKPLPKWSRTEPDSEYDKMLGVEPFYDFMAQLPGGYDSSILEDRGFTPSIYKARSLYSFMEMLLKFMERPSLEMLKKQTGNNKFMELALYADDMLVQRDSLAARLLKRAEAEDGRASVIAGGMFLLLAKPKDVPAGFADELQKSWRKIRQQTTALQEGEKTPEQVIETRKQIMKIGFPGDSLVKQAWAESFE